MNPIYFGISVGYGNTNWAGMDAQDEDTARSTPSDVENDAGLVYGGLVGYELNRYFALEFQYKRFPTTEIYLAPNSFYNDVRRFKTKTWSANFLGKLMIPLFVSRARAFAGIGIGYVHRKDFGLEYGSDPYPYPYNQLPVDKGHGGLVFTAGVNYLFFDNLMSELAFEYNTGFDKAEKEPLGSYVPFLYTITLNLSYRFHL